MISELALIGCCPLAMHAQPFWLAFQVIARKRQTSLSWFSLAHHLIPRGIDAPWEECEADICAQTPLDSSGSQLGPLLLFSFKGHG